jgi:hypothetical protein
MWRATTLALIALAIPLSTMSRSVPLMEQRPVAPRYLRVSVARWNIDTYSADAERIFDQIDTEGVGVFRAQPGFVRYRLMRADSTTTIAVAEWESEELGKAGAERYRAWMRTVGIMDHITLETNAGDIVAGS